MKLIVASNPYIYFNSTDSFRELFNFITNGDKIKLDNWMNKNKPDFIVMKR
jgi:hypothetical protein